LPRKSIQGLMWFHLTSAILTLFLQEAKIVCLELLLMEKRDWPAASTITELSMLEQPPETLSLMDGCLVYWEVLTGVVPTGHPSDMSAWPRGCKYSPGWGLGDRRRGHGNGEVGDLEYENGHGCWEEEVESTEGLLCYVEQPRGYCIGGSDVARENRYTNSPVTDR